MRHTAITKPDHACADPLLRGFQTYGENGWEWLETVT